MNLFKNVLEKAFDLALKAISAVGEIGQIAKNLKVSVKLQNLVETKDPLRSFSLLAEKTWIDLFEESHRCQMNDLPVNVAPDLLISITSVGGKLVVAVESEYLKKTEEDADNELAEKFKEFIEGANKIIDETFGRDRSLTIDGSVDAGSKTQKVLKLSKFFDAKLSKIFFAVLVKKFVAEAGKKSD